MLEALLFDLDGLLLDTEPIIMQACDHMGERLGVGKAGSLIPQTIGMNSAASNQHFRHLFGAQYDITRCYTYFNEYINQYTKTHNGMPVKAGARTALRWLHARGYKLGVATCKSVGFTEQYLARAGMLHWFQAIVGEDIVMRTGDTVDAFTLACRQLGVSPAHTMVVEDAPSGIRTASQAGMVPVMVPDLVQPDHKTEPLLYARCDSLFDLIGVVSGYEAEHRLPLR